MYMLLVYGSMDSLLPRIWAVEAVGIGATRRLFLIPCLRTTGQRERERDKLTHRQKGSQREREREAIRLKFCSLLSNFCLQFSPVPEVTWGHSPHVVLQDLHMREADNSTSHQYMVQSIVRWSIGGGDSVAR